MNSKRQVKGKLHHVVQITGNVILNLSVVCICSPGAYGNNRSCKIWEGIECILGDSKGVSSYNIVC